MQHLLRRVVVPKHQFVQIRSLSLQEPVPTKGSLPLAKVSVIAHRGASGRMPDHTLETYKAAFESGADWIEMDAHSTKDGHLVVNHDIELGETTDVADWAWAASMRTRTFAPCYDGEPNTSKSHVIILN